MEDQKHSAPLNEDIAGFWIRLGGFLIDSCLYGVVFVLALYFVEDQYVKPVTYLVTIALIACVTVVIAIWGQTPGMALCGLQAVAIKGGRVGWFKAVIRSIGFILSHFLYLGFLLSLANRERRTFHDFIAGTKVLRTRSEAAGVKNLRMVAYISLLLFPIAFWLRLRSASVDHALTKPGDRSTSEKMEAISEKWKHAENLKTLGQMREFLYNHTDKWKKQAPVKINRVPELKLPNHEANRIATVYGVEVCKGLGSDNNPRVALEKIKDTGGWGYISAPGSVCDGHIFFDCTHIDSLKGYPYADW